MSVRNRLLFFSLISLGGWTISPFALALSCWMTGSRADFGPITSGGAATTNLTNDVICNNQEGDNKTRWVRMCFSVNPEQPRMLKENSRDIIKYNIYKMDEPDQPLGPNKYAVIEAELPPNKGDQRINVNFIARITANQQVSAGNYIDYGNRTTKKLDYDFAENKSELNKFTCTSTNYHESPSPIFATAEVKNGCDQIHVTDLNFGPHSPANGAQLTATESAQITLKCPPQAQYTISLDMGQHRTGNSRQMCNDKTHECINYGLYQDQAHSRPWDDSSNKFAGITATQNEESVPVHGYVPPQNWPSAGDYEDTVVVTLNY
ncbi:TPA: spore coat protein U domain-containing protein [Pluralibacter gergoviae]|uniref:Csu type fimbrial protein n=1 Tax=Pluralibacter gergoviae TaxID=61647 RepID=UPI0009BA2D5A|nr:spore coat U domain-containing protein [Pluralibacter gergoviae]MBL3694271.1 spore coat protein U domain-containing protein [Pluralibacter gergoviae]HDS1149935.1 spore coat protein U domain-containing protein [Pluralibacter gergoviae]